MPETYRGFELNIFGDPEPWATRENILFKGMLDVLVPSKTNTHSDLHQHSKLYASNGETVLIQSNSSILEINPSAFGTLPSIAAGTKAVIGGKTDGTALSIIANSNELSSINFGNETKEALGTISYDSDSLNAIQFTANEVLTGRLGSTGLLVNGDGSLAGSPGRS